MLPFDPIWLVEQEIKVECPKCSSEGARYERDGPDILLRCMCGYCRVVASQLGQVTIEHFDRDDEVSLPRPATKLWYCLMTLFALERASTADITNRLNFQVTTPFSVSDVASQLTVLRYKRLVQAVVVRKGKIGGSVWTVTDPALKLLRGA